MFEEINGLTVTLTLAVVLGPEVLAGHHHLLLRLSIWDLLHDLIALFHYASTAIFV